MMKMSYMSIAAIPTYDKGYREGAYRATVKYEGAHGTTELQLTPEITGKILAVIAGDLVQASKEIAEKLMGETFLAQAVLPNIPESVEDVPQPFVDDVPI